MTRRGHRVVVATPGERPTWFDLESEFLRLPRLEAATVPQADVTVATYWTTIEPAVEGASASVVHYCQGFEGSYTHNEEEHPAIEGAYSIPLPAFAVSDHLQRLLQRRFGRTARVVPQPLEEFFRPAPKRGPGRPARILVPSPFEIDWKGVETGLRAVARLRERTDCRLIRLSQWPRSEDEARLPEADEFHCHLEPREVATLLRSCDLVLTPSWEQEGFGLPALEAMASGVPVVASDVSCYRDWAEPARLATVRDPGAFAEAAEELLSSSARWQEHRRRGLVLAERYREERAAEEVERALYWVARGEWRQERPQTPPSATE